MNELSPKEQFWLWIMRRNEAEKRQEIIKHWKFARLKVKFEWRSKKNLWGRFGGGWNWKIGVQIGGSSLILDILTFSLRFSLEKSEQAAASL